MSLQNHWKEASNLILLSQSTLPSHDSQYDYQILTVRGNPKIPLQSSSYVFPGGQLESPDFSCKWWSVFEKFGFNEKSFESMIDISNRPPIITDNLHLEDLRRSSGYEQDFLPTDIALRICAIRHTFQQTGILMTKSITKTSLSDELMNVWKVKVSENPNEFINFCEEYNLYPDVFSLYEWWNWLTPSSVGRNPRFDTIYYISKTKVSNENESQNWCSPQTLLSGHITQKYFLSPPQTYELSRIMNFHTINEVNDFAAERQIHGVDRWLPMVSMYKNGAISTLPGDDYYPKNVELFASKPVRSYSQNVEEIRLKSINMNRIELKGHECEIVSNIEMQFKHVTPVNNFINELFITAKL